MHTSAKMRISPNTRAINPESILLTQIAGELWLRKVSLAYAMTRDLNLGLKDGGEVFLEISILPRKPQL